MKSKEKTKNYNVRIPLSKFDVSKELIRIFVKRIKEDEVFYKECREIFVSTEIAIQKLGALNLAKVEHNIGLEISDLKEKGFEVVEKNG
jgi:hypothetical protein